MKKSLLVFLFSVGIFSISNVSAAEPVKLYYSDTCPHCIIVKEEMAAKDYRSKLAITETEVGKSESGIAAFYQDVRDCGLDPNSAGIPLLVSEGKCYMGDGEVLGEFARLTGEPVSAAELENTESTETITPTALPIVDPGIPQEEAKRNTLLFIGSMTALVAGLVALGYWKQRSSGKTPEMAWILILTTLLVMLNGAVLLNPLTTSAFCPVCTVAVGAGLGVSKSLGIDDVITSIWIGGLMVSMTMWLINWLDSKKIRFLFRKPLVVILMYGLVIWPLSASKIIGTTGNVLWGVDKVILGMIIGTIGFIGGYALNAFLVNKNKGAVYFPFQKVALPLMMMIIQSLVFFFIVY